METNQSTNIPKKKSWKKIAIIFSIVAVSVLSWVGFTKAGYIPNFLDIEILCPANGSIPSFDDDMTIKKPAIYLYPEQK